MKAVHTLNLSSTVTESGATVRVQNLGADMLFVAPVWRDFPAFLSSHLFSQLATMVQGSIIFLSSRETTHYSPPFVCISELMSFPCYKLLSPEHFECLAQNLAPNQYLVTASCQLYPLIIVVIIILLFTFHQSIRNAFSFYLFTFLNPG